ncbi:G-protein coupled receptor Mth2 isoform X2 [Aethina tumida]|uniref:G-protein coupled receptor Mth2 isoform X2 n=1 Tax=Aethina tumida TaxID=116153 RepID=UPI002148C544|nr:G-protein coupled receptor Mth2 isoform X2 [Aethina tumida]
MGCVKFLVTVLLVVKSVNCNQTSESAATTEGKPTSPGKIHLNQEAVSPQIDGFSGQYITSGPIVLVNNKELFISNVKFNNDGLNAVLSVGDDDCIVRKTIFTLDSYDGHNLIVDSSQVLKKDDTLCVYSDKENRTLAQVRITEDVPNLFNKTEYKTILRLPKCCPFGEEISTEGCVKKSTDSSFNITIDVLDHNTTHLNLDPLNTTDFAFIPYVYNYQSCDNQFGLSEEDIYHLLKNGSLIVKTINKRALSHGKFCFDQFEGTEIIIICHNVQSASASVFSKWYVPVLCVSFFCFVVVAGVYYYFLYDTKHIHKQIFSIYSVVMAIAYLTMIILYYWEGCSTLGYFTQGLLIAAYYWVFILCADCVYLILNYKADQKNLTRLCIYSLGSLIVIIFPILAAILYKIPNMPSGIIQVTKGNKCDIQENNVVFFTVPCAAFIILACACVCYMKYKILQIDKSENNLKNYEILLKTTNNDPSPVGVSYPRVTRLDSDPSDDTEYRWQTTRQLQNPEFFYRNDVRVIQWDQDKKKFTFMFRQCILVILIVILYLVSGHLCSITDTPAGMTVGFRVVGYLQGILILFLTVGHWYHGKSTRPG